MRKYFYFRTDADEDDDDAKTNSAMIPVDRLVGTIPTNSGSAGTAADGTLRAGVTEGFVPVVTTAGAWAYVVAEEALSYGDAVAVGANGGAAAAATGDAVMGYVVEVDDIADNMIRIKLTDGSATAA